MRRSAPGRTRRLSDFVHSAKEAFPMWKRAILSVVALTTLAGGRSTADDKPDAKKVTAEKLGGLEYPGSKRYKDDNLGPIAQLVLVTHDELAKVDEWYRKRLGIDKDIFGGVADIPWPSG